MTTPTIEVPQLTSMKRTPHHFGWKPDLPDARDIKLFFGDAVECVDGMVCDLTRHHHKPTPVLPAELDLRTLLTFPDPYDQLDLGSCTANATGAALEVLEIAEEMPSRLFEYFNTRWVEGTVSSDSGGQIRDAIKVAGKAGICPESEWPYDPTQFAVQPPQSCYIDGLKEVALTYSSVSANEVQLKSVLASKTPVVVGITVYSSFESPEVAQTGIVPMPDIDTEQVLGGHAILLIGYSDATQTWLLRNSWGSSWGQGGYFTLPYAYLTTSGYGSDYWAIEKVGESAS
jgi:C1A family cysteine protease